MVEAGDGCRLAEVGGETYARRRKKQAMTALAMKPAGALAVVTSSSVLRLVELLLLLLLLALLALACAGSHERRPSLPPPEYEEPLAPPLRAGSPEGSAGPAGGPSRPPPISGPSAP
jgi:hypothetical protein